jgi:hypothetical protein
MKPLAWISVVLATVVVVVICTWMVAKPNRTVENKPSQATAQTSPFSAPTTSGAKID